MFHDQATVDPGGELPLRAGANGTVHQHIFRARFTDPAAGSETIAKFVGNWLNGTFAHIGP